MTEKVYKNAPLVEVICEIRWQLKSSPIGPDFRSDPYFDDFLESLTESAEHAGFVYREQLQDTNFPREMRPNIVEQRFRKSPDSLPLFQTGPGVFSVNTIPPYGGWNSFKEDISKCVDILKSSYPLADKYLKISQLELRYINAFRQQAFGKSSYDFISEYLNIELLKPTNFLDDYADSDRHTDAHLALITPLSSPELSESCVTIRAGAASGVPSLLGENLVRRRFERPSSILTQEILDWFDAAHMVTKSTFEALINQKLRQIIGPETEAEA